MKAAQSGGPDYAGRIWRAQHLASAHPFTAEVLNFYKKIAEFQKNLYERILRWGAPQAAVGEGELRSNLNLPILLPHFPEMLKLLERNGPPPVQEAARRMGGYSKEERQKRLEDFWRGSARPNQEVEETSGEPLTEFIVRAFLQPYSEFLAGQITDPLMTANYRACPRCGSPPLLGVLRPEGDGGKRRLMCSFCLQEWDSRRIFCAACGEDDEKKLPVYVAEQFGHIRVEACETCRFYVRTIDLTKNGNAVPLVDDLAAIPLTLWAQEHGYTRVQGNLLGT